MRALTPEQVRFFRQNGYLTGPRIGETEDRKAYFDRLIDQMEVEEPGRDPYALMGYHTRCAGLWDLVLDDRILDVIEDLIGPDIVCWSTQFFNKKPSDDRVIDVHQDAAYWSLEPHATVSAWVAVDASTLDNGCLHVIPGSHVHGVVPWTDTTAPHPLAGTVEAFRQSIVDHEQYGELVPIELQPGEISLHADLTMHASGANPTGNRRAGFAIRYCPPSVRPTERNWGQNAVLCRGEDRFGHFGYVTERPTGDDTSSWATYLMRKRREARKNRR